MKDFWEEEPVKENKLNRRKLIICIILAVILVIALTIVVLYNVSYDFRTWADKNILNKEILQDSTTIIELDDENSKVYAFNKSIAVLSKNKFKIYNNFRKQRSRIRY